MRLLRPLADRFWEKVDRSGGPDACWPWIGAMKKADRTAGGKRGVIREAGRGSRMLLVHRVALALTGERSIESALEGGHLCDNPICCNPSHLLWMTRKQNARDYVRKFGRLGVSKHHRREDLPALLES